MPPDPQQKPPEEDPTDVLFNLRPMDFQQLQDDGEVVTFEALRHDQAAPGSPVFGLRVHAPSPRTDADHTELERLLGALRVDFLLVAPVEEDLEDLRNEPEVEGLDPGARLTFEAELRDVNQGCVPAGADLLVAADPPIRYLERDTWRSIRGVVRRGTIKVTAGRAELRGIRGSSSTVNAVSYTASLQGKTLAVIGRGASNGYTFYGRYKLD